MDVENLRRFTMLRTINAEDLAVLAATMIPRTYASGAILFRKGEPGDALLLILSGEARVYLHDESGHEITLRTLRGGHILGEFSTLDRKPHSASVAALTELDVLELNRHDFLNLLRERPLVGMELMRGFAERIRYATSYLERLHDAIELLTNNAYDEAIREMALTADEDELHELISSFLALVHHVQAREEDGKK